MKKSIVSIAIAIVMLITSAITVFAITDTIGTKVSWNYSTYEHGSYVPKVGWAQPTFYNADSNGQNCVKTYCEFTLDDNNVSNILQYNAGTHPADSKNLFFTLDITSVRNGSTDKMDAYAISTSLPNPKTDLENDDLLGDRNEESEVVALGTVEATTYNMSVMWYDYREGETNDNGQWQAQFNMSGQYIGKGNIWIRTNGDYNNVWTSDVIQATMAYALTDVLICGECGSSYRRAVKYDNGRKKVYWRCLNRTENGTKFCKKSSGVREEKLHSAICRALSKIAPSKDEVFNAMKASLEYGVTNDDSNLNKYNLKLSIQKLQDEAEDYMMKAATTEGNKEKYFEEVEKIFAKVKVLREQLDVLEATSSQEEESNSELDRVTETLKNMDFSLCEYDDLIVRRTIECIKVMSNKTIVIIFKGGFEVTESLEV